MSSAWHQHIKYCVGDLPGIYLLSHNRWLHLCNLFTQLLCRSISTWWINRIKGLIILRARCLFFKAIQRKTGTIYCSRYVPSLLKRQRRKFASKACRFYVVSMYSRMLFHLIYGSEESSKMLVPCNFSCSEWVDPNPRFRDYEKSMGYESVTFDLSATT